MAELGVDKRLIKNKKILGDLLEKEKEYGNNELLEVKNRRKHFLRIVSPKRLITVIWKPKAK